ncbi:hypothetical protein LNQ49_20040 [Flavobacterium sp. F-65]|uniref:DoxX-like family protein n=1 Tax=Flavobacterium pisciphilum TaxID=2893755 RepID=A0ABS8MYM0_9FLAO|nr:hypothetical protein [Flavobacterium sp. F-65]MCC9073879.1 hypothetical protein [Flavobacterium sp. F-65]
MQQQGFLYKNLDNNFFLKEMLPVLLALSLFVCYYIYSSTILMNIGAINKSFLAEYFCAFKIGITLTGVFFFYQKEKINNINISIGVIVLFASFLFEHIGQFLIMNSLNYSSVLYLKTFPNITFWFGIILFIFSLQDFGQRINLDKPNL